MPSCQECSAPFTPRRGQAPHSQAFCSPACKLRFHNRMGARGKPIMPLIQTWRAGRGSRDPKIKALSAQAFAEICRLADAANREDRETGRPSATKMVERQYRLMIRGD